MHFYSYKYGLLDAGLVETVVIVDVDIAVFM